MIILKSESKPDGGEKIKKIKKINDDKNMVQIHDEQRSFHMTMLHRDIHIHKNTAQTSTVILYIYICIYAILSFEYFVVHRVSEPYFYHHNFFFLSLLRRVLTLILKLSTLSSSSSFYSFNFILFLFLPTRHYHLFHHYSGSQCCYYCFMCSLLACILAGTYCKNRQLPKILIIE